MQMVSLICAKYAFFMYYNVRQFNKIAQIFETKWIRFKQTPLINYFIEGGLFMEALPILILLTLCLCSIAIPFIIRSFIWNSILKKLYNGQYTKAIEQMNRSTLYKLLFSEYERNYNLLRTYISQKDVKMIKTLSTEMLHSKLNPKQAYQVASLTFFYFIEAEDASTCTDLLKYIEMSGEPEEIQYDQMLYRIIIEKKSEDIDFLKSMLEQKSDKNDQGMLQYFIGIQYLNSGNKKEACLFLNKAKNNLKGTPYHKKIKELLV